jgi:hypothetical protein
MSHGFSLLKKIIKVNMCVKNSIYKYKDTFHAHKRLIIYYRKKMDY